MLTALDLKSQPFMHRITRASGWLANRVLRGNFRWQTLPAPFNVRIEGLKMNGFEEFGAGEVLRNIRDPEELYARIEDPAFRDRFRKDIKASLSLGLWHRRLADCWVRECPDASVVGRNFEEIGQQRCQDAVDAFFDLASQYRDALKWTTCYGNHRPQVMHKLLASRWTQPGFADSGAHLASHAQYNFPLRFLKYVRDAELAGQPFMDVGHAVGRLTGELADFAGVDAGYIRESDRADLVIVNPAGLTDELDEVSEAPMENLGMVRLVKRNDVAVEATVINGRVAYRRDTGFVEALGKERGFGRFLEGREIMPL